ncbi:sugar-binding protein [Paenibacillus allorhizoplanae]|nr:sugar-binding protein [Paenibacillus allorhizoplanae]
MFRFQMPYGFISQSLGNNTQYNPGNNQVIRNAFEFFNKRGNFYFDQAESTLYYIPLEGEDINTADVVIPRLETVLDIRGIPVGDRLNPVAGSDDGRVKNITFNGLKFAHTDYKLTELTGTYTLSDGSGPVTTSSRGYASVQGSIVNKVYFPSSINWHETFYRGYDIPPAAVMINAARNIKVLNGEIGLTGFNGIHVENDAKDIEISGNYIVDTLASGIVIGHPQHIYENDVAITHESSVSVSGTPIRNWAGVDKEKFTAGTEAVPENIYITNNFLYRTCYGFPGANALASFYTTNMQVLHNYIYDTTYGAMSIGWGWDEYDGFGFTAQGTNKTGGPYNGTSETSIARSPAISTTSRNNKINFNRIEQICTVVNDSGAIYSLGRQGDPGNLPGGGTWDTINTVYPLTNDPVTNKNSNWNSDNWTNFTEMNYNFLNPNPTDKPTDSNNWMNGFHPDEGSTFIKMIGNVVQAKLSYAAGQSRLIEFNNWKRKSDMIMVQGYVDGDNNQNGAPRTTYDNYKSTSRIWPLKGNEIVLNSGLTNEYTYMIPRSLIADTEFELASNVIMGKGEKLNRRGLLKAQDTVWIAPANTTVFNEGTTMTKAAGDVKSINAPSIAGEYKLFIKYGDGRATATSKYTVYVDASGSATNVENGKSYEVSAVRPLKLTLSTDYTFTLNGKPVANGYEIRTAGSWTLVGSTSTPAITLNFTTTVSEANRLLPADVSVAPGGKVRFAYDLDDATKQIWISSSSDGNFIESDKETMASGNMIEITAPKLPGPYIIYVRSKEGDVLSQSHASVVVRDMTPADIPRNGLDLWLKADEGVEKDSNGNVTGWTNMGSVPAKLVPANVPGSGGDNLGTPNGNPTLKNDGYDYVDFAAMSRPLKAAGFKNYNGSTQMTIYALVRPTTTANNSSDQNGLVYFGLNEAYQTWAANSGWSGINLGVGTNRVNIRFGNTDGGVSGGGQQITTTATDGLASVRAQLNGTNRAVFVNNNVIGTGTNAKALLGNSPDLGVGYTMAAATPYRFLGRVSQILIYDRVLTADEITKVETYFNNVKAGRGGPANPIVSAVDKTLLTALIESANNKEATIYTSNSWNAFASALSEAKTAVSNGEIGQAVVDNSYYALRNAIKALQLVPSGVSTAVYGTPVLGGAVLDLLWDKTATLPILKHLTMVNGPTDGYAKVLWDDSNLYVLVRVKSPELNNSSSNAWEQDSVEIFVDETNSKQTSYGTGMGQYRINYLNVKSFNPGSISAGFESFAKVVDGGYYIETKIPFKAAVPTVDRVIGFDLQINDAKATGGRQDIIMWHDVTGQSYANGSQWGVVALVGKPPVVTGAAGATSITTKDGTLQMLAGVPVVWSVTAEDGSETNAAIISETGLLSAKKNGVVKVTAKASGSSLSSSALISISGQEVDTTPPTTVDDAPIHWVNHDAVVNLTATDSGSGVGETYYTIDGGVQQAGTTVYIVGEGTHSLIYWSVDNAGNVEQPHTAAANIDMTTPVTALYVNPEAPDGSNGWYAHAVTVSFSAADNLSGAAKTEYSLDDGSTWLTYTAPVTLSQDNKYTVSYRSTDNAGNVEAARMISFNLDQAAPTITVSGLVYGSYSDSMDITPILTLSDNLSGVDSSKTTVTLDTKGVQQGATIPLYTLPLGSHMLIVTASDLAGNTSSRTIVFQTTASIQSLQAMVSRFKNAGWIDNAGIANSLQSKLTANSLADFVSEVQAQSGKHISAQAVGYLLRDAWYLLPKN